jgi:hypothetical protein
VAVILTRNNVEQFWASLLDEYDEENLRTESDELGMMFDAVTSSIFHLTL